MVSAAHVFDEFEFDGTERQRSTHRRLVTNGFLITVKSFTVIFLIRPSHRWQPSFKNGFV